MLNSKTFYLQLSSNTFIELTVDYYEEQDRRITAKCRELGTATFGNSPEEAEIRIKGAIETHLIGLSKENLLNKALDDTRVKIYTPSTTPTTPILVQESPIFLSEEPKKALSA